MRKCLLVLYLGYALAIPTLGQFSVIDSLRPVPQGDTLRNGFYVDALNEKAYDLLQNKKPEAVPYIEKALFLADSLEYAKGIILASWNKGLAFSIAKIHDQATFWFHKALSNPEVNEDLILKSNLLRHIAACHHKTNAADSAFDYYKKSWEILKDQPSNNGQTKLAFTIAELFRASKNNDSAKYYFSQSYLWSRERTGLMNKAWGAYAQGELALIDKHYFTAIQHHTRALEYRQSLKDQSGVLNSFQKLASLELAYGNEETSNELLRKAEKIAADMGDAQLLEKFFLEAARHHLLLKDYETSDSYLTRYQTLKDNAPQIPQDKTVDNMRNALWGNSYGSSNGKLQRLLTTQSIKFQFWAVLSVVFLISLIFIFLFYYRRHLKNAKQTTNTLDELNNLFVAKNKEIKDINEHLDAKLSVTSKMLSESQKIAKLGSWEYSFQEKELQWTDETFRQLDLEPDSLKPSFELFKGFLNHEDQKKVSGAIREAFKTGEVDFVDVTVTLNSGEKKYIRINLVPEFVDGRLVRIYGSNQDITEKVKEELQEKDIIQSLLDLSKDANLEHFDFTHFIEYLLRYSTETLKIDRATYRIYDPVQRTLKCFQSYNYKKDRIEQLDDINQEKHPIYFEAIFHSRTLAIDNVYQDPRAIELDKTYLLENEIYSVLDAKVHLEGELLGVFSFEKSLPHAKWTYSQQRYAGSLTDIIATAFSTYQNKKLEKEKEELISRLIKKSHNLEELAYVISHYLRGPVTQIMGLSDLYTDPKSAPLQNEIIQRVNTASFEMDQVIRDLTEVLEQQADSGENLEELSLEEILHQAVDTLQDEWSEVSCKLHLNLEKDLVVKSRKFQLFNIIYTILCNSFQYRKPDSLLEITVKTKEKDHQAVMTFSDNGLGIDLKRFGNKIFKMYQRFNLDVDGAGIGLFIVKSQVEMFGGSICVDSSVGNGATFTVSLPLSENLGKLPSPLVPLKAN